MRCAPPASPSRTDRARNYRPDWHPGRCFGTVTGSPAQPTLTGVTVTARARSATQLEVRTWHQLKDSRDRF